MSGIRQSRAGHEILNSTYVLTADCLDNIIWGSTQKFCDDRELVDMVFSGEKRLALEHLRKNTACTPDVYLHVVFLPCEHDLRGTVITGGNVTGHLGVLYTGQAEIADLQIAVLVDENVTGLQITVHNASRVDVFQTTLSLVSRVSQSESMRHVPESGKGNIG